MNEEKLKMITKDILLGLQNIAEGDLESIILYGSYARGDYDQESDLDIAVLLKCNRMEMKKYNDLMAELMVDLNLDYDIVVSFCCIPYSEFNEKKNLLPYYMNIDREGVELIA